MYKEDMKNMEEKIEAETKAVENDSEEEFKFQ